MMAERAFRQLLLLAFVASIPLSATLSLTLFPGEVQRALHGYDAFVQACSAALYGIGERLPPIGAVTLILALAAALSAGMRAIALTSRTRALTTRCRPVRARARVAIAASRLGLAGRLTVFSSPGALAFTAGLLRPRVYLSSAAVEALASDELEAVLLHERAHMLARDPLRVAVARLLTSALFFIPLADALRGQFELAKELDADREVLAVQRQVAPLAGALDRLGSEPALRTHQFAVGAWSGGAARIDQLEGIRGDALLPALSARASWVSALAFTVLVSLAMGQAARANIVPAAALDLTGAPVSASVHVCPLPLDGPLF